MLSAIRHPAPLQPLSASQRLDLVLALHEKAALQVVEASHRLASTKQGSRQHQVQFDRVKAAVDNHAFVTRLVTDFAAELHEARA